MKIQKKTENSFLYAAALKKQEEDQFIRYTPTTGMGGQPVQQRIIQISQAVADPLDPPRHKHKKILRANDETPPVVMRSPPRKLTKQDQDDWRIPACISNWQNANGFTIPLHMRLQADGRGLQDVSVNERHAAFADALYTAEKQARIETEQRSLVQNSIKLAQAQQKE